MTHAERALELFKSGCNCSQSIFVAYAPELGIDELTAKKLSIGLGGGVGRLREICGAVTGAAMVIGMFYSGESGMDKAAVYEKIQAFAEDFRQETGFLICRDHLGIGSVKQHPKPEERTEEYYKKRPCPSLVYTAAELLEKYLPCER